MGCWNEDERHFDATRIGLVYKDLAKWRSVVDQHDSSCFALYIFFSFLCIVFYVCFASAMLGKPCQELLGVLPVSSPDGQWQNWNGTCCCPGVTSYNRYVKMHYKCLEKIKACLLTTWVETPVQGGRSRCARKRGPSQRFLHCFWIFWRVFQVVIQEEL